MLTYVLLYLAVTHEIVQGHSAYCVNKVCINVLQNPEPATIGEQLQRVSGVLPLRAAGKRQVNYSYCATVGVLSEFHSNFNEFK